jgi:hypothetical protein
MRYPSLITLTCIAAIGLASSAMAAGDDYPFVGKWDCEIAVLTFDTVTYHDGTNEYPMAEVAADGLDYTIKLTDDYIIGLSGISQDKMSFSPIVGGDLFPCFRLE